MTIDIGDKVQIHRFAATAPDNRAPPSKPFHERLIPGILAAGSGWVLRHDQRALRRL